MIRCLAPLLGGILFATTASASLAPYRDRPLRELPRAAAAVEGAKSPTKAAVLPRQSSDFVLTETTQILLNGKMCKYRDVPAMPGLSASSWPRTRGPSWLSISRPANDGRSSFPAALSASGCSPTPRDGGPPRDSGWHRGPLQEQSGAFDHPGLAGSQKPAPSPLGRAARWRR